MVAGQPPGKRQRGNSWDRDQEDSPSGSALLPFGARSFFCCGGILSLEEYLAASLVPTH